LPVATMMYSVLYRRRPQTQYLLELITFNDGDSGRCCCARQHLVLPSFSILGHNLATKLFQ